MTRRALKCPCGRQQHLAPAGVPGGITVEEAHKVGWRFKSDGTPVCPFCSGNTAALARVFGKKLP